MAYSDVQPYPMISLCFGQALKWLVAGYSWVVALHLAAARSSNLCCSADVEQGEVPALLSLVEIHKKVELHGGCMGSMAVQQEPID